MAQQAQMFANTGAAAMLAAYFNNSFPSNKNLTLKLFTNNRTPASTDTASSYTEAAGGGYAAITLANGSWTVSLQNGIEQAAYAQQTFTFTGQLTTNPAIYGFFIVDGNSNLITAQLFTLADGVTANPFTPANNGDQLLVTPLVQLSHGTPTA